MLLIWFVRWYNGFGRLTALVAIKTGRFRPRVNIFLCDFRKAQGDKPFTGEG